MTWVPAANGSTNGSAQLCWELTQQARHGTGPQFNQTLAPCDASKPCCQQAEQVAANGVNGSVSQITLSTREWGGRHLQTTCQPWHPGDAPTRQAPSAASGRHGR